MKKKAHSLPLFLAGAWFALMALQLLFGLSPWVFLRFTLGILAAAYIPGFVLCLILKIRTGRLERVTLSLALGMTTSTLVYKAAFWAKVPGLFLMYLLCAALLFIWGLVRFPPHESSFRFSISRAGLLFGLIGLLVLGVLAVDNYRNGRGQPDGSITMNLHYHDGFFRNAYVRELSHSVPPQTPFAAGIPVGYHYGQDLFVSMFYRFLGISVLDLLHRLVPTFFLLLLMLTAFIFIREFTGSSEAALLGLFLILFGSGGLSYLATWILGIPQWGNLFYSFYFLNLTAQNAILPAVVILFAGLYCVLRYLKLRSPGWLILSGWLLAQVLEFKMVLIFPLIAALFTSGLIMWLAKKGTGLLKAGFLTSVFSLPLLGMAYFSNAGGPRYVFQIKFVDWVIFPLKKLDCGFLLQPWQALVTQGRVTPGTILLSLSTFLFFLLSSFGLSFAVLPGLIGEYFAPKKWLQARHFLMTLFGGSVLFYFLVYSTLGGRPRSYFNISTFYLGVMLLMVFFADRVLRFLEKGKPFVKIAIVTLILLLSVPNTYRFLQAKIRSPQSRSFPESFLQAADWVNQNTDDTAVLLHPEYLRYVCYFADRRVVMDRSAHSYLTWNMTTGQIAERGADIDGFFVDPLLGGRVLAKYRVSHVWLMRGDGNPLDQQPPFNTVDIYTELSRGKIHKAGYTHRLEPVYHNGDHLLFRVLEIPPEDQTIFVLIENESGWEFIPFDVYIKRN
jgi:hypothetical protein